MVSYWPINEQSTPPHTQKKHQHTHHKTPTKHPQGNSSNAWCAVDPTSCSAAALPTDTNGQLIAPCASTTNNNNAAQAGTNVGCDLVPNVALASAAGSLNQGDSTTVSTAGQCCSLCSLTPGCAAFSFIPRPGSGGAGGTCWLRPDVTGATAYLGAVSGVNRGPLTTITAARRRSLLQDGSGVSCPRVFVLPDGQPLNATRDFGVDGVSWQQVCFGGGVTGWVCVKRVFWQQVYNIKSRCMFVMP